MPATMPAGAGLAVAKLLAYPAAVGACVRANRHEKAHDENGRICKGLGFSASASAASRGAAVNSALGSCFLHPRESCLHEMCVAASAKGG